MRFLRGWRLAVILLAVVAVGFVAWAGWTAWKVNQSLSAAVADARELRESLEQADEAGIDASLSSLRVHTSAAAERTDGATWDALTILPKYGDDAEAIRTIAQVLDDLASDGLEPLTDITSDLDALAPSDGAIDLAALEALTPKVLAGSQSFERAAGRLEGINPLSLEPALRSRYRELLDEITSASESLSAATVATKIMPTILGADGPRDYLLAFQNNAEIRATGGLPGAVSLMHTEDGRAQLTRQVPGISFGRTNAPVLPLTQAERDIYGEELGLWFVDANFTPDFPRVAALMKARWEQVYPEAIDGVITVDPVSLSYALTSTGPVTVGGRTLTSDNVVEELLHEVYLRFEEPEKQDAFFQAAAAAIFGALTDGVDSPENLFTALARGVRERRIRLHSFEPVVQDEIAGSTIAGELVTDDTESPQVGVYLNDATGAKMSYFLRHDVKVTTTFCKDGVQGLTGKLHLLSDAPEDAASLPDYITGAGAFGTMPGSQLVVVRLVGPVGGSISAVAFNSKPVEAVPVVQDGRPVVSTVAELTPGFTLDVTWRMLTGTGQTEDVEVESTPSVLPVQTSSTALSACS
ncbi:hypothetical protein NPS01_34560 [Nocardioides psychrotolerans]|uniref:DUF4012 domain-containing protein n=1 Tax=Nocardioides psychrotolerans TaxID=1005945 RepID=A0A1I3N7A3_9ACTN|nr:DUF4012 domain-containing protein [Nocardioides psychrotolerans]GEP39793.1 hypothetical protein NPS01_34560 [Nocardioides psychrotolerans]SFJ05151.1 Protein of unknown function [Nocardioides psychrotolerans]